MYVNANVHVIYYQEKPHTKIYKKWSQYVPVFVKYPSTKVCSAWIVPDGP